jgi:hypothetical protein
MPTSLEYELAVVVLSMFLVRLTSLWCRMRVAGGSLPLRPPHTQHVQNNEMRLNRSMEA